MENELVFHGRAFKPDVRRLSQMRPVLFDRGWATKAGDRELYYMYRSVSKRESDRDFMERHCLRYDVTVIPSIMLGVEHNKTYGHYHPDKVPGFSYPELYTVLEGEPTYLMQRSEGGKVSDAYFVKAKKGDSVLIPSNYGHITINAGKKPIKMANWVCGKFSSIYGEIEKLGGAAYFLLKSGWVKNERYGDVPALRELAPTNYPEMGLREGTDTYDILHSAPRSLKFLCEPERFPELWQKVVGKA